MEYSEKIIVIVDDEPQILRSLQWELEIAPLDEPICVKVFEATSEAMEFIIKNSDKVFLLITDLRMPAPNLTGSDFLLYIHELFPKILLILLTAYSDLPEIQKAITAEIQALIFKPWSSEEILSEIKKAQKLYKMRCDNSNLQKRVQKQLEFAGEFQKQILKPLRSPSDEISVDFKYEPLSDYHCGGDYYDLVNLNRYYQLLLLGDVSGHGITPAFVTAMLKIITTTILREMSRFSVSEFLTLINKRLCDALGDKNNIFVTFTVVLLRKNDKRISVAGAGNLPIYILRNGKCYSSLQSNPVIGFRREIVYTEKTLKLQSGDKIVLFTDGLIEIAEKGKMVDDMEIKRQLERLLSLPLTTEVIFENFKKYHSENKYSDDVTIAVVSIK